MNEDAIKDAYDLFVNTGYNKSYDNFKALIQSNPNARKDAYDLFVGTGYNKTQKDFDQLMGIGEPVQVKKKEQVSPSQQKAQPTSLVAGGTMEGGPSVSSVNPPSNKLQEELFQKTRLAASAVTASAKPGYTPVPKEEAQKALYGKANVDKGTLRGIPGETKSTVSNLNDKYKDLGFQFEEVPSKLQKSFGLGDIVVTADDGSTHIVQSTGADEKLKEEEAKLQTFLMGKSAGAEKKEVTPMDFLMMSRDGISPQEENKFKRVYSQELVDNSIKFANNELEKTKNTLDELQAEKSKIEESAMISGVSPEMESRYSELRAEQERSIKYAKSIASLTDEGVKKAAGENVRIMGEQGNLPSAAYNSLLKFAENSTIGALDIFNEASTLAFGGLAKLASINMGVDVTAEDLGNAKAARDIYTKAIDNVMSSVEAKVSEEYIQSLPPVLKALVGAAEFVPNMLIPGKNIRYGVLVAQGVGRRMNEFNDNPMTKDLPEEEKFLMSAVPSMVEAALENFGISQWAGVNKGLISSVTVDVLSKVVPQTGMRGIKRLINAEINNLVLKGATNVVGAMASEFETGALQSISDTAFREAYEIAKGKDLFKQPGFGEEGFKEALLEDAKMEALGGMWMAGASNIAQQTSEYITGKSNTNETFALMKQILASNTTESALASTLKSQIISGSISKEQAQNTFRNFREAKAIVRDIPQDLSEDNQRAAFDLLAEKRKLTKQIEGKDPSLVNKQKKRIAIIENELINISNAVQEQTTSEVPVQPEARVGEEVVEGKPQPEPQGVAEEGQVQKEVTQYIADLQETKQSDPEQYWSVDSVTEEAAKEGTVISDEDGGVVVSKDGDIKGLFKKAASKAKGVAQKLLQKAVQAGGIKLDNFDNYLTPVYEKAGFRVVSRVPFNEEYAPEGWNKEKHGTPDVVAMVYDPQNKLDIQEQKFENYDEAMAYRDQLVEQAKTEYPMQSNFDEAVNKSAQALNVVAPGLKVIVGENVDDVQNQIVEAIAPLIGEKQAVQTAEEFAKGTKGQTIFVDGKPFAVVFDKTTADSRTAGHEAWEVMLNDAFGNDQARFKEFSDSIDAQLRAQGFGDIADALDAFASQRGYEAVKYSEYMAELGGMLVEAGFGKGPLTAQQKTLLQKIGDIINKFAELFTGKKQFLDQATPEDILGFMVTISEKVAKGEDVASFFRPSENTETIKDTKKVLTNRSQKIGDFDIQYFEDEAQFKDLVDRKLVVQNASIDEAAGQPVATHQPDNLLVGNVNYKGKQIMEGNGGIYYVLKFGNVWASGKQTSAKTLANYINKSRKESTDGIGRMVLVRGSQDKMISSVQGVKAAMRILEELVFDNLISTSDFRKALTSAGKAYNIDFSGSNSAKQIQKDIEDKFMNVADSTFAKRGDFFSKLIDEIGKLESANKNIKEIRKALGTTKNIQFSREGIRKQIGTVLTERLLIGLDNSHAYAMVEVDEDVVVKKDDQHPSYPFSIVTKSGKPPVLKVFNYRPKAVEAITTMSGEKASNAQLGLAQMGMGMGRVASDKEIVVKSRSQKNVPPVVDEVLTDDGKGNYLFVHYSNENRDVIKPMAGSKSNFTSREEVSAISAVGGVAMYYTKAGQKESGVGDVPHTVLVPKDKVYFYGSTEKGTVSHDPEGFEEEARQRFQAYRNRGNEDRPTKYAFDANNSAAWVTKVAAENGYDMLVTNWGGPKSYRAQTTKALKPEAEYTGFKKPEPVVFEVGDEVSLYGRYATIVDVDGDVLTYESPNAFGRFDTGKFTLSPYTSYKITMIEKAKPSVTSRSQKVEVKTIPGYDRMMNEVEGIMDKTINRGGSYNQASANAINYIQKSASYERADDIQREQIIRDFKKIRGEKFKVAPSVAKILGQIEDVKKVTVKESTALKDQIKLEAKAAKDSAAFVKQLRMDISGRLKSMVGRGMMSARQATAIISRYDKMNILNPVMRDRFVDYMSRVFQSAEYMDKIKEASKLRASIKKNMKSEANQAEIAKLAKDFGDIDPSRVENIDDYINNATQMLNAVARKTGDPLMRSLVNAADMASYIETEIEAQREQIKNELLDKYKELVDAGVLSSDMTINEIKKVVAAIEENDNEAVAKEEKARAAVKEMMAEVSPLIVQIVKTGEDPFTGEPITLTQDEKKSLIALTKMDTDSLSLSEAVQVLEYANNFVANGITSGIDGMVSLYQGGLNAGELVEDGIKSIPLSKYFSKLVGRVWGEGFATLPMLNKLLWGNTRRAIMVSEKAGINGVSNGKAKALKMVDTAVKQYVKQFSKTKNFLASENVIERGMLAFMSRNVIGDEFQVQDEFNRRKTLIEETIQALSDVDNNTDAEIKKGEVVQKVYDKILKDAKNIDDVKKNVSTTNQEAVDWWTKKWSENFDRIDEVSRNVYNTLLSRDINYTPDRFQMKEAPTAVEEDFESGFFGNFEYVDTSKSGSLRQNNRIKTLPKDKNGVRKRIVNLDFDVNNVNALTSAMVDVETASSVMQLKGFVTSKNFSKLFSNKDDKNLYKKRLIKYVNRAKGGSYVDQNELAKVNRFINTVASFGVAKALFSASQPFKQFIPPMLNTLSQTGRFDIGELFRGGMSFIDKSGYPIANRGVASQGELKSINRQLVEAEKHTGVRLLDFFANISNKALELTLKNPDVYAARASWISFYLKGLQKQGQNTSNIDWNTHQINKKAADYAQAMVDSQQNISDTDMQGEIFASKQPATVFLRRAILPLMTFTLNQKTRVWSDIRTFSNGVSSNEDKIEAAKSLTGALIELAAFQGVALAFKELYNVVAASIMGEDEDEEEKKIRKMRQSQTTAQAFMKDFFLPPIPVIDIYASKGINYLLDETGLSDELPYKWYGIEDEEQKYRLYDKMNQGYLDMLGTQGIALEKGLELIEYYDAAIDGEFTKEYNGNKVKKALMEEDLDIARMNAFIMTAYYGGVLPSDMANVVNIMNKKIQKRAEQVDED